MLKFINSFQVLQWVCDMTNIHLRQCCNWQTLYAYDWNQVDTQTSKWKIQGMDSTVHAKLKKYLKFGNLSPQIKNVSRHYDKNCEELTTEKC